MRREYNGYGQMTIEYQASGGAVNTSTSPKVQYVYSEMAGGANHSRLTSLIYPNGKTLTYVYTGGWDGSLHDKASRVYQISDSVLGFTEILAYLGRDTAVYRQHNFNDLTLTYVKLAADPTGDAGDQ